MKHTIDAFFVDENTLRNFLRMYGRGHKSRDHELAVAIHVKRLFEKHWDCECCIAFELNSPLQNSEDATLTDLEKIESVIRKKIKENSPIDFLIVKGTPKKHSDDGFAFQLKRFGIGIKKNFLEELSKYINDLPKKIGDCGEVGLIIAVDPEEELDKNELDYLERSFDLNSFRKSLSFKKYPYRKIFLLGNNPENIHLTEVWPGKLNISVKNLTSTKKDL